MSSKINFHMELYDPHTDEHVEFGAEASVDVSPEEYVGGHKFAEGDIQAEDFEYDAFTFHGQHYGSGYEKDFPEELLKYVEYSSQKPEHVQHAVETNNARLLRIYLGDEFAARVVKAVEGDEDFHKPKAHYAKWW